MEHGLDVDGRNVVSEQHDLVGVYLVAVFSLQVFRGDQARLQQPSDEGARSGEGIDDMNLFGTERLPELRPQELRPPTG